jgi:NADH-quinone oxidoreductase subunit L
VLKQVVLVPLLPLAGAAVLLLFSKRLAKVAGYLATVLVAASFVVSLTILSGLAKLPGGQRLVVRHLFAWMVAGTFRASVDFRIDPLSVLMILFVTGVGMLIHWYAIGYMARDEHRGRFFAYLNLFIFSMVLLVLAGNFLVMYAGWELVGLCSYLLIAYYFTRPAAAAAGKKAFFVTRIGDLGMLIGLFAVSHIFHSLDFGTVFGAAAQHPAPHLWATAIPLLLFCGAVGKSAQIPLYVWLPDAMEGPTPVSALIHAATMVTAGVYLVARAHVLFEASHVSGIVVAGIGVATVVFSASMALTEDDIKRVLAYSTISQLGYMFVGVGVGALYAAPEAYEAGLFHLVTHAFFKALLFLAAGSVMHAMHDTTDMKQMGGLLKKLPVTGTVFVIGGLALSGIPPFAGFFSKDAILGQAWVHGDKILWALGILGAFLTAFYIGRQIFLTFFGESRVPPEIHPHEAPRSMTIPLIALAGLATLGGFLGLGESSSTLYRWLDPVFTAPQVSFTPAVVQPGLGLSVAAVAVGLVGLILAYTFYLAPGATERRQRITTPLAPLRNLLKHKYYVDEIYGAVIVAPALALANAAAAFDAHVIDGAAMGVGKLVGGGSQVLRRMQSGLVRRYVMTMLGGIVLVVAIFLLRVH